MRRLILPAALVAGLVVAYFAFRPALATLFETVSETPSETQGAQPPPATPDPETRAALEAALEAALVRGREMALAFVVFDVRPDLMRISADGAWAVIWLAAFDRETGERVAMEPWLAIATFPPSVPPEGGEAVPPPSGGTEGGPWIVTLPGEPGFPALLAALPEEIFTADERLVLGDGRGAECDTSSIGPFTGYKLPWEGGKTLFLTQSIYHTLGWGVNPTFSMLYAFDFSTSPSGYFNIWAARPGTVKYFWDQQVDNDPASPGNYIVLEDTGTSPKSYQLYLHLAQNSIPAGLKTVGAVVQQGQVIGVADDTGFSTGHHLHFQVHTEVAWWGCSVDVRFADVPINGGRPRLPIEAQNFPEYGAQGQTTYVSGNTAPPTDTIKPGGGLAGIPHGLTVDAGGIALDGYAFDEQTGIESASFAVRADGDWTPVGEVFAFTPAPGTVYFSGTVDLCSAGVPDGPVALGVIAEDRDGNRVEGGLAVPAVLDADCGPPPPACLPAANQVALYSRADYQGACVLYGVGTHSQPSSDVFSVLVGADVSVTLFKTTALTGRARSLWADNANLSDDWTNAEKYAGIVVRLRTSLPAVPKPAWPVGGAVLPYETPLQLVWDDGGGGAEFQVQLDGPSGIATSDWITRTHWHPGGLVEGGFSWQVRARSTAGTTAWSPAAAFAITRTLPITPPATVSAPVTFGFENGGTIWETTGFWNLLTDPAAVFLGVGSFWYGQPAGSFGQANYDTPVPNAGSLTSPSILVPGPDFYLRFFSNSLTEGDRATWDRRSVYISAAGGPYEEVYVLAEDTQGAWVQSPYIDLSAYAGQEIRIRFVFDSLDARRNLFAGWRIDQVKVVAEAVPSCPGAFEPNGSPALAAPLSYGDPVETEICPAGDVDYFSISGQAGDRIVVDLDAKVDGSPLDASLYLFDADGTSLLAFNHDEAPGALLDPRLAYTLPRAGTYFIQVRRHTHPGDALAEHTYRLVVLEDAGDPVLSNFTASAPLDEISSLPASVVLSVDAADAGLGVASVEFLYHNADWGGSGWISLGIDTDGSDGWSAAWDTQALPPQPGMALVAVAVDPVGNRAVVGMWDLFPLPPALYLPVLIRE